MATKVISTTILELRPTTSPLMIHSKMMFNKNAVIKAANGVRKIVLITRLVSSPKQLLQQDLSQLLQLLSSFPSVENS